MSLSSRPPAVERVRLGRGVRGGGKVIHNPDSEGGRPRRFGKDQIAAVAEADWLRNGGERPRSKDGTAARASRSHDCENIILSTSGISDLGASRRQRQNAGSWLRKSLQNSVRFATAAG